MSQLQDKYWPFNCGECFIFQSVMSGTCLACVQTIYKSSKETMPITNLSGQNQMSQLE